MIHGDEQKDRCEMRWNKKIIYRALIKVSLIRKTRRIILSVVAVMTGTLFVLGAWSAPQNPSGQSNSQQQGMATDWKPVEQALGKAGSERLSSDGVCFDPATEDPFSRMVWAMSVPADPSL
jgi:hypothetical protein